MNFHVLTLFPEMIENGMNTSITGRAITKGLLTLEAVNIRDYAFNKHQKVDDYTYGGGAGMLMQAEPVYLAYEAITKKKKKNKLRLNTTLDEDVFNILKEEAQKEGHNKINKVIERITREYLSEGREISSTQLEVILNEFKKFIEQKKIEEKEPTK